MKILALHLPQYHAIPENDEWWGKGFTDWDNVKKARPLFEGHNQPIVPLNNNYYDMTDPETFCFQADLAQKYGVYGFIYYHYWFNGKRLLEKPCEVLLNHPEIKNHYCFCWANETWARTWDGHDTDILIKQEYGGEKDWKAHIDYLMPFFKDERYIKVNNKPMMFFYSCCRIEHFNEMVEYWNGVLRENGFDGMHVVEFINSFNRGNHDIHSDVVVEFEPLCTSKYYISPIQKIKRLVNKKLGLTDFLSYDYIWKKLISKNHDYGKPIYRSCFVDFDNSARKGKRALIMKGGSPEKFGMYLRQLVNDDHRNYDDAFLMVNAWNEWAEGAILEPTIQNGHGYLEQINNIDDKEQCSNESNCIVCATIS